MSDPFAVLPYHDSSDQMIFCHDQILMPDQFPTLGITAGPTSIDSGSPQLLDLYDLNNLMDDDDDPVIDPVIWEMLNDDSTNNVANLEPEVGYSGGHGETNVDVNFRTIDVWPVQPSPYNCSCCQILREFIHTNGSHYVKLEVHGRVGMITHAILDKYDFDLSSQHHEYQMFDFCKESITNVKQFLVKYCEDRKQEGYYMLQDPLFIFYEALSVGLNSDDNISFDHIFQPLSENQEYENNSIRNAKISLSEQRERTGKLKLKDICCYFHLPIDEAAKQMNICPTVMKKICRRGGLSRWPYRKIRSIQTRILKSKESLDSLDRRGRAQVEAEIHKLEEEIANILSGSSFE